MMWKDLRYGVRMLLQAKGWTAVVVLSLALGIGANTAIFSAVNALLLTQIPVQDPETLVRFRFVGRNQMSTSSSDYGFTRQLNGESMRTTFSYPMYRQFVQDNQTLTDLIACAPGGRVNVVANGRAELASAFLATGNYFRVLGINARLGRVFGPDDDRPTAAPVAVISERFWRSRFGSDEAIVGKVITVNQLQVTIIGVLPASFTGIQQPVATAPAITFPVSLDQQINPPPVVNGVAMARLAQPTYWWLQVMGRLEPGVTPEQVRGNFTGVFQATAKAGMDAYLGGLDAAARLASGNRNRTAIPRLLVEPGARGIYDVNETNLRAVRILTGVVALVLLIVCANVANLLLSRSTARQKEISVRLSVGATRGRLIRQMLIESVLLACLGGALGIAVAYWGKQLLPGSLGELAPLDWRVLAFTSLVVIVTGVLFGIAPALRTTRADISSVLKETSRSVAGSRSLLGKSLLVVQVAISLVLVTGAGLFLRTLDNLRSVNVGFDPTNLVLFRINPQLNGYNEQRSVELYQQLTERLGALPGARAATLSNPALLSGSVSQTSIFVQGRTYDPGALQSDSIHRLVVAPNFFDVMGMPVKLGRGFTEAENNAKAPKVAILNEAAARKYFPDGRPVGGRIGSSPETSGQLEVVGIVRDAKYDNVRDEAPPTLYVPFRQTRMGTPSIVVRTAVDPLNLVSAIRETVRSIDPNLPIVDVSTQMENMEARLEQEKIFAHAYSLFGGLALVLAAVGLYGVMSYTVARRTNEIGIRLALGAQREQVLGATMRESMVLVAAGAAIGIAIVLAASRFVASLLFNVPKNDLVSIALAAGILGLVSAAAAFVPAHRASRVDPMVALRNE
jgi:predicted permease